MDNQPEPNEPWLVLLPLLIVLSTFLFLLLLFLLCILLLRRRRSIILRDSDGPIDMSREDLIHGEGGFEGVESRWLESVPENARRDYVRARDYQLQYPPNSLPTDITLSQFLSIQEKGVSAWCFEPDYETVNSLLVHARTEITFLPDPASSSCVQSNLPLPKLNEVYYWEIKMFDLPPTTNVAVGLATKPYPPFRLPGQSRYSVAYLSNGDKSHNYPFTASSFNASLKEGDILGVGYRPRTGTVFFTRNGRKLDDAYVGLNRFNLFPTIGADGPCSVHVNLGQGGFVFVEANVKKWGLAPSVGTLAPPPAYGSERGSILLDVGGRIRLPSDGTPPSSPGASPSRRLHRTRRPRQPPSEPIVSSPLRTSELFSPPPPITPVDEEHGETVSSSRRYISPTDLPFHVPPNTNLPPTPGDSDIHPDVDDESGRSLRSSPTTSSRSLSPEGARNPFTTPRRHRYSLTHIAASLSDSGSSDVTVQVHLPPESPMSSANPPTPNRRDIHLQALSSNRHRPGSPESGIVSDGDDDDRLRSRSLSRRDPPAYSPLDAFTYADGVHIDLPAEFIAAALEGNAIPASALGQANGSRDRRRSRRH
ncbi:SPRY-domain-containing protein [Guyanagaster necrorhizus]|uniref:SPRY-domain-containing protein n=1 Tax=Guyanagaster necrorhizus TaxID=856835 RepID=A0A9P7W0R4_9AGAR|nr:SPRY-domain-containing protein [Guyanagaster necrorhizus MCA 3950]KAG7450459.1 SPRY-domain-containing protein [Guyanagaster necrorhizus MCA 3950]